MHALPGADRLSCLFESLFPAHAQVRPEGCHPGFHSKVELRDRTILRGVVGGQSRQIGELPLDFDGDSFEPAQIAILAGDDVSALVYLALAE